MARFICNSDVAQSEGLQLESTKGPKYDGRPRFMLDLAPFYVQKTPCGESSYT